MFAHFNTFFLASKYTYETTSFPHTINFFIKFLKICGEKWGNMGKNAYL